MKDAKMSELVSHRKTFDLCLRVRSEVDEKTQLAASYPQTIKVYHTFRVSEGFRVPVKPKTRRGHLGPASA